MKEYTLLSVASVFLTIFLDCKSNVGLLRRKGFYVFLLAILFFKFLVNGYLTGEKIVIYNPRFYLGIRLGSIPLEDFLFGFSMVSMSIIFWEYFKKKFAAVKN
ncbi:lycopene cyclase domain-containing protein [Candidatus Omnitrophota bacterium]